MIVSPSTAISLPPPPSASLVAASTQAVSRTDGRLRRVEQVEMIAPWQPRGNQHRPLLEGRPGGFQPAADPQGREASGARYDALPSEPKPAGANGLPTAGSLRFLAHVLGQDSDPGEPSPLGRHRDGASLASFAYRRAGADPTLYSEDSALLRIAA